ncbi:flagellar export chaperone FliS [Sulfurospirillum sp. 1612]|uniref:flagellar export chaperone FliS n=1 Tax=Sulfurospirillum sp. 1612 TaxID=3094835 RepID=UPI002F95E7EF
MSQNAAYAAYSQNNLAIESPEKLITMLYEGILKFASHAKRAIEHHDLEKKSYWINRSVAIYIELLNALDYKEGNVAHYLSGLYVHQIKMLSEANIENDTNKIDTVLHVTKELLAAWEEETRYAMAQ